MEGDDLSRYVLVFTLLSCVVVSKGGVSTVKDVDDRYGVFRFRYTRVPATKRAVIADLISIRDSNVPGGAHGYELHVPKVVTNNTVETLVSACSNSSTCQGNRTDGTVYDYYCNCGKSCVKYDTCCNDSNHGAESGNVTKPDADVKCVSLRDGSHRHVFMVDTCKVKDVYVARSSRHVNTHIYTHCRSSVEDNDNPSS
ncbi:hypothetical protein CEXT_523571 [Caerostris extrusa]|uniref:SMB domain-containing protein n=1 Tax=Caerostris extrusa TaxID=172846 RepID=A0AAV4RC38_CAEEX|nr:hypothetical protein CEXT_523571 [Caerostris extrusa]